MPPESPRPPLLSPRARSPAISRWPCGGAPGCRCRCMEASELPAAIQPAAQRPRRRRVHGHPAVPVEAPASGAVLGLRALTVILCGALYTAAVDPDEVLRLFRRVSFRSALTATLATRMIPVLVRDSRRLADAQRCRPGPPPSRFALTRAASSGMLDRALDVSAALEVRGYGASRPPPRTRQPWSRHDLAFFAVAASVIALAVSARVADLTPFHAYPALHVGTSASTLAVAGALVAAALVPFADRRGIVR